MTKNAKSPFILAGCGCASLIASIVLFAASWWMGTPGGAPADDLVQYRNTREGRSGNLAENYVGFELSYPESWTLKSAADDTNFVSIERSADSRTWENLNVGYFKTAGTPERNASLYGQLIASLESQFGQQFPGLRRVHERDTKVGEYDAHEALFHANVTADGQPVDIYIRAVLLPTPDGTKGVTLLMMGTSFHPDLKEPDDLGTEGELPIVLDSFRFTE
ncbi:MAG: hypothetical protein ACXW5U_30415 [Thermoanaerobaculia bacterium]